MAARQTRLRTGLGAKRARTIRSRDVAARERRVRQSRPWLLAIVRNTSHTWQRQHRASAAEFDETVHSESIADEHPESALSRRDSRETLAQALDRLPPEFREVIVLREVEGLSYKEISGVVDVPVGTVMSRLSRARKRLQQTLIDSREDR